VVLATYSRVEESSTDAEEHPHTNHQTESENQTDVQQYARVWCLRQTISLLAGCCSIAVQGCGVGYLGSSEGEEQEHERSGELCNRRNDFVSPFIRHVPAEGILASFDVRVMHVRMMDVRVMMSLV
jgi:hypothetical protein